MRNIKFTVKEAKFEALYRKMASLGIEEKDIEEKFIRSSGPGGQKLNKSSSCVYLKHKPTGIEVKYQKERSQAVNRFLARRRLTEKIENLLAKNRSREQKRIFKLRKQKKKRSKRTKEKILKQKLIRSKKKELRKPPDEG